MSDPKPDAPDKPKAEAAKKATITLHYAGEGASGDLLSIGKAQYPITDGIVEVALEHVAIALEAGFRH